MILNLKTRSILITAFDLSAVVVAWILAYTLRFNFDLEMIRLYEPISYPLFILLFVQLLACRILRLHRGIWVFASLTDIYRTIQVAAISLITLLIFKAFVYYDSSEIPRSIFVLYPLLLVFIMGGARFAWRAINEYRKSYTVHSKAKPVIIVGAGEAGIMLMRELDRSSVWRVVTLLDDDERKLGLELLGRRVVGSTKDLAQSLKEYGAKHVIIAIPSAAHEVMQNVTNIALNAGAAVFTVPNLEDLMSGRVAINAMRPVNIEDLLGRDAVELDTANISELISNKCVLVSGAGGSIGSELCRQIAKYKPQKLVLVELSEFALYTIEQWFSDNCCETQIIPLTADVKNYARMKVIFEQHRPSLVFHAAAYKHVPLMEVSNAFEAIRNNSFGTYNLAKVSVETGVRRFVLISTDKAVNPTNVMGATKRLAEKLLERMQTFHGQTTTFNMVRFGNVLGSTGSVIPKFQKQIQKGGPITVTHPDINRYFMSIPEAAQLVIQAATMGQGGEVFVLDMGKPVRIVDLAKNMIRLSGFTEDQIAIEYTGLRPGEKLYEELMADEETTSATSHGKLRIAKTVPTAEGLIKRFEEWISESDARTDEEVRKQLKEWIPEYNPSTN